MPILIVDDNAPSRFLRSRILERAGFEVREADSVHQVMAFTQTAVPSLVLLDVALPDGDGFEVCERLKATHPELPVVMITTVYQTAQARRDAFHAGADAYLLDPVEPERLVEAVARFLDPSRVRAAPAPPTVVTDYSGQIVSANPHAARLLNLTMRGVVGRSLLTFFDADRTRIAAQMRRAAEGRIVQVTAVVRPRERKPYSARVEISAAPFERGPCLEWVLEPVPTN